MKHIFLFVFFNLNLALTFCYGQVEPDLSKDILNVMRPGTAKLITKPVKDPFAKQGYNIYCSLMDKEGNLWFGTTHDGVYRYDGETFINYTTENGLNGNGVYSIYEDRAGNIWFSAEDGLGYYNGTTIQNVPISTTANYNIQITDSSNHSFSGGKNGRGSILQDSKGILWFGRSDGVYRFDGKSFSRFLETDDVQNPDGIHLKSVQCMLEDRNGNIWFGSGMKGFEGISVYDGKTLHNYKPNGYKWILSMVEDQNGNIWFSVRNYGAFRYDGEKFTDFTEEAASLIINESSDFCPTGKVGIGPVLHDHHGNMIFPGKTTRFGGDGGLLFYDGNSCTSFTDKNVLGDLNIWSLLEDRAGNIWIGTNNTGLYRFDGKTFVCFSE